MPRIDMDAYNAAEESQGGFVQMEPGAYKLRIKKVLTEWDERDFNTGLPAHRSAANGDGVLFIWDVDEGDHAGEFSRDFYMDGGDYAENKYWMHQVKYTWGSMGRLKKFNRVLSACNPGFDPMAACQADQWQMFIGRVFCAVLNGTVKTNQNGYDSWTFKVGQLITEEEMRNGEHDEPKITDKRDAPKQAEEPYDYVPFD